MITYLIEVTICWAGFYGLYALLLSGTTFFRANRFYLLGTLLFGLLVPLLPLPTFAPPPEAIPGLVYLKPVTVGAQQLEVTIAAGASGSGFDYYRLFGWIYLGGILVFGSRFLYGLWQIGQLYRAGRKERHDDYTLVCTREAHLPFSFFNYLFWSEAMDLEDEEGRTVLQHEYTHMRDGHSLDILLIELLCIVFWVSPFVYLYRRSLRTVHEYLADRVVLETTRRKKYGRLLLQRSQSGLQIALANHFYQTQIKKRIMMMIRHRTSDKARLRYLLVLPLLILFLLAFANRQLIGQTLLEIHRPDGTVEKHTLQNPGEADDLVKPEQILSIEVLKDSKAGLDKIVIRMKNGDEREIFKVVEEMPRFPGCEELEGSAQEKKRCADRKMLEFVYENVSYPDAARKDKLEGTVVASFTINRDGSIGDAEIMRDIGGGAGEEILRVIEMMPDWIPGRQRGKNVAVRFNLPVKFKLPETADQPKAGSLAVTPDRQLELKQFSAFPNPTAGQLQLSFQGEAVPTQLNISDTAGRVIFQAELRDFDGRYDNNIDLSRTEGTLLLTIRQGDKIFTQKIVVK